MENSVDGFPTHREDIVANVTRILASPKLEIGVVTVHTNLAISARVWKK